MFHKEQNNFSIAKQVKIYIERKPYILEAIEQNIVNNSALVREIEKDLNIKNYETIKAAIIRSSELYRKTKKKTQQAAIEILHEGNVSVKY